MPFFPAGAALRKGARWLLILVGALALMGNSHSRAEIPSGEPASGKIDLAALVRKHTLSNQELFALAKGLMAWPPEQLDGLPDALHLEFRGYRGPHKQLCRDDFELRWGPHYFRPSGAAFGPPPPPPPPGGAMFGGPPSGPGLLLGVVPSGRAWYYFRAARDDPHPGKKGAVLAIQIEVLVDDRRWDRFRHVQIAFRKGRVSLKEADLVRAWGTPDDTWFTSHLDPEGRDVPYSHVWYDHAQLAGPNRSDFGAGYLDFTFYTASSEEVPLEICVFYPTPWPKRHGPLPETGLSRAIRKAAERLHAKEPRTNATP